MRLLRSDQGGRAGDLWGAWLGCPRPLQRLWWRFCRAAERCNLVDAALAETPLLQPCHSARIWFGNLFQDEKRMRKGRVSKSKPRGIRCFLPTCPVPAWWRLCWWFAVVRLRRPIASSVKMAAREKKSCDGSGFVEDEKKKKVFCKTKPRC